MSRHVNLNHHSCRGLSFSQGQFFLRLVPLAQSVRQQIILRCDETRPPLYTPNGLLPSVIIAWSLRATNWGTSALCQPRVEQRKEHCRLGWQHGNNLLHLRADKYWAEHCDGIRMPQGLFKSFPNWDAFAIHLVDLVTWRSTYQDILAAGNPAEQIELISVKHRKKPHWKEKMLGLIRQYHLEDFDDA